MNFNFLEFVKSHTLSVQSMTPRIVLDDFKNGKEDIEKMIKDSLVNQMTTELVEKHVTHNVSPFTDDMHSSIDVLVMSKDEFKEAMQEAVSKGAEHSYGHAPISFT